MSHILNKRDCLPRPIVVTVSAIDCTSYYISIKVILILYPTIDKWYRLLIKTFSNIHYFHPFFPQAFTFFFFEYWYESKKVRKDMVLSCGRVSWSMKIEIDIPGWILPALRSSSKSFNLRFIAHCSRLLADPFLPFNENDGSHGCQVSDQYLLGIVKCSYLLLFAVLKIKQMEKFLMGPSYVFLGVGVTLVRR